MKKDIPGYEGLYQVTDEGDIISLNYKGTNKPGALAHNISNKNIHTVILAKDGAYARRSVAQLVAQAFVDNPNPADYKYVTYKDGNRNNLRADNLKWIGHEVINTPEAKAKRLATRKIHGPSQRSQEAIRQVASGNRRRICAYDDNGELIATFRSITDAHAMLDITSISQALKEGCRCKGYYWKYVEDTE